MVVGLERRRLWLPGDRELGEFLVSLRAGDIQFIGARLGIIIFGFKTENNYSEIIPRRIPHSSAWTEVWSGTWP